MQKQYKIMVLAVVAVAVTACGGEKTKDALIKEKKELQAKLKEVELAIEELDTGKVEEKYIDVQVSTLKSSDYESFVEVQAVVESGENVVVIPESNGVVKSIKVREGQSVKRGQVIAVIDAAIQRNTLKELETSFELADDLFQKQQRLRDQNVGSEVEYLQAKNNKESIEARIATLKSQIAQAVVTSPISGKVEKVFPKTGEMASMTQPIARIVNARSGYYVEGDISEAYYRKVNVGDDVIVRFPFLDESYPAQITTKGNFISAGNRTFKFKANLKTGGKELAPNLLAAVRLRNNFQKDVITVPVPAIQSDQKGHFVYLAKNGGDSYNPVKKYLEIKHMYNNIALVESTLEEGEMLITRARWDKLNSDDVKVKF